jgi:hypothetical protein
LDWIVNVPQVYCTKLDRMTKCLYLENTYKKPYTLWHTTNAIYWFSVAKLVTLVHLFTK